MAQGFWSISICLCMGDFRFYFNMISTSSNVLRILAYRFKSDFDVRKHPIYGRAVCLWILYLSDARTEVNHGE